MTTWSLDNAAFVQGEEVAGPGQTERRQPRQVARGEGMLAVTKSFRWNGETFTAGRTRVVPDHPAALLHRTHFTAAWPGDSSPEVLRFLRLPLDGTDRSPVSRPRTPLFGLDYSASKGRESWRLPEREPTGNESWRL